MSATLYPTALAALLNETLDWTAEEIHVILLGPSFVFDSSAVYVDEIPPEHIIATSVIGLTNRSYEDGVARGDPAEFLQDVGDPAYSPLIAYYDEDNVLGVPKLVQGTDEYLYAPLDPGGWFQIVDSDMIGPIGSYGLGDDQVSIAELDGGLSLVMPVLLLQGALNVSTHKVCATPDEDDTCCEPTIRSSRCD
jgi:hypothetical protein